MKNKKASVQVRTDKFELLKKSGKVLDDLRTKITADIEKGRGKYSLRVIEALSKAKEEHLESLADLVLGKSMEQKQKPRSFVVGEVFRHRDESCIPQYHGDNAKSWIFNPNKDRSITIAPETVSKLSDFLLPKAMNDTALQKENKSTPVQLDTFLLMLYMLIIEPKLGKEFLKYELGKDKVYVFHVQLKDRVVALRVRWFDDVWDVCAYVFDYDSPWCEGYVFLFPATA